MPHDLHIVLIEPKIPQNTGSVGRLCLGVGATLHLIEPMDFDLDHTKLKRAGLDYWEHLKVQVHPDLETFIAHLPKNARKVFIEVQAGHVFYDHEFQPGTYIFFGPETGSIPDWVMNKYPTETYRIPMYDARIRSLNLANSVSIVVYEAIRQLGV